jgi:DNA-binding SARP family transcriptional activator
MIVPVDVRMGRMGATGSGSGGGASFVRVFGGVGVDGPDGPIAIGGHRQQRLLALLVIRHGQVVTLDWLAEYLWDDAERPDASATRLRTYLSRLRQSLPEVAREWIETEPGGYRFVAPPDDVEHLRFERLRAEAREARDRGDPLRARQLLDEAMAMWRGDPFRELEDLDWALPDVEQLRLDRLEALEERWESELALGRHTQITGELSSFVREQPLRERAVRQYALALHRSGRTAEALRTVDAFRSELADRTGLDPSPALVELEQSLLGGDPSLTVEAGRPLRGYRLLDEVGAGAFAVVWRAVQPSVDRDVAIKQIRSGLVSRPEFIRRFEVEARLVARIEHPFIVPLIDYWRDPDSAYLVMRWLAGGTLERRLDDGPLAVDQTLELADQIGAALSAAHRHGVVHRDVKSSNVLFDEVGNAYLSDFGIALEAAHSDDPEAALSRGSPVYAAPEQLRGDPVGPEADVFSLGVVLYECLTGSTPFATSGTIGELVDRQLHEPFPDVGVVADSVPVEVSAAVTRATAKDPADRYPTVDAFVAALRADVARAASTPPPARVGVVENPYLGLRAFDDGDADRFFGRDRLVDEIVGRLSGDGVRSRCVVLIGPSGSGKSSVVRAGVVPGLRRGAVPGSADWFTTTMVPGLDAYESLEAALLRIAVNPPASLVDQLRDGERGVLRGVRRCLPDDAARVVVVIDQLEELFTGPNASDAGRFLDALAVAIDDPASPLRIVATLRADYYDRPLQHPTFARIVKEAAVEITPLAPDELVTAISEPARHAGVGFEPGLVARIAAEAVGQPSPLPLLQYTLSELFDRRDGAVLAVDDYEEVGGIGGALAARAEALHADADAGGRVAIRSVFGRLTDPTSVDARRRVPVADFGDDAQVHAALDRFGRARLLAFDRDPGTREPTVEVAHEALLRAWPRAAVWLEEDRDLRRAVESIGLAATEWDRSGRLPGDLYRGRRRDAALDIVRSSPDWLRALDHDFVDASRAHAELQRNAEQRRIRRLRRLVAGTAVALVVALVAGGLAITQQQRADREAQAAEAAAQEANRQRRVAEEQAAAAEAATSDAELAALLASASAANDLDVALLVALEARRRSPGPTTDQALLDAIAASGPSRLVAATRRLQTTDCGVERYYSNRRIDADGLREFGTSDGRLVAKDLVTGTVEDAGSAPRLCTAWFEDAESGRRWAGSAIGDIEAVWVGSAAAATSPTPWVEVSVIGPDELLGADVSDPGDIRPGLPLHLDAVDDRLLFYQQVRRDGRWTVDLVVVDERTLEPVGSGVERFAVEPVDLLRRPVRYGPATAASEPMGLFAAGGVSLDHDTSEPFTPTHSQDAVVVLDAATGGELLRALRPAYVSALAFDPAADAVIVGDENGAVDVIGLDSGAIIQQLVGNATDDVIALGVRTDGVRVVVGRRSVELFDQRGDRVGFPVAIPPSRAGWVRPDGSVMLIPDADTESILIVDPAGGPLVEQGWSVDATAAVTFGAGRAGVVDPSGPIEIVELETGDRASFELVLPNGEPLDAVGISPEPDGFLAWDRGRTVARWRDGKAVEHLELYSAPGTTTLTRDADVTGRGVAGAYVGAGAAAVYLSAYVETVYRFDPTGEALELTAMISSPPIATVGAAPSPDGGLYVVLDDGLLRTYDRAGRGTTQVDTGLPEPRLVVADPTGGLVAIGGERGAVVVRPATGTVHEVDGVRGVANLGFARAGSTLVVVETDGTVRLWDVARDEPIGTLWTGTGTAPPSPPWYDPSTDTVWVATSGTILQFSLDPERWAERACALVSRELTPEEWDRLIPGDAVQRPACG